MTDRPVKYCIRCGTGFSDKPSRFKVRKYCSLDCMLIVLHASQTRHGESRSKNNAEYRAWSAIKRRCLHPSNINYPRYGGRGITVCEDWQNSFEAFLADMGRRPSPTHSIDRIDNDGGYEKSNCRWATPTEQHRNKSVTRFLTFNGQTRCMAEWAEHLGIPDGTLRARVRLGWSDEEALTGRRVVRKRQPKAACSKGHPFDAANTYIRKNGHRMCWACQQARNPGAVAAYRARKRRTADPPPVQQPAPRSFDPGAVWLRAVAG